ACAVAAARDAITSNRTVRGWNRSPNPVMVVFPWRSAPCSRIRETSKGVSSIVPNTGHLLLVGRSCAVGYRRPARRRRVATPREGGRVRRCSQVVCLRSATDARSHPRPESLVQSATCRVAVRGAGLGRRWPYGEWRSGILAGGRLFP